MQSENVTPIQAAIAAIDAKGHQVFIQSSATESETPDVFTISLAPRTDGVEFNGIEVTPDALYVGNSVIQLVQIVQDKAFTTLRFNADVETDVLVDAIEHLFGIAEPKIEEAITKADEEATEEAIEATEAADDATAQDGDAPAQVEQVANAVSQVDAAPAETVADGSTQAPAEVDATAPAATEAAPSEATPEV